MRKNIFDIKNKNIVLTGSAGFLGSHYAEFLSSQGANIILVDIDEKQNKKLEKSIKSKYGTKTRSYTCDLSNSKEIKSLKKSILKDFKTIDVLINNAAYQGDDKLRTIPFEELPLESWNKAIDVNLTGIFLCCQEIGKIMLKQKNGVIINISSTYGIVAPDQRIYGKSSQNSAIFYAATKSAVLNLTRYLAAYWQGKGIRVNTLSPGGVERNQEAGFRKKYANKTMLGRMAKKDEYVGPIIFLASDASSYMTGSNLIVDGGWTAW